MNPDRPGIAVLGTLTRDTTEYADGTRTGNFGGLVYTLTALASLFAGRARIRAVANAGADLHAELCAALDALGVDAELVRRVPEPNNHVRLKYHDASTREEILSGCVPPVEFDHAAAAADAGYYIVNLTSGRDIRLETLQRLRPLVRGVIQLDIHSLTLDIVAGGRRELRYPEDWRAWAACADVVQVNETEARLLAAGRPVEAFLREVLGLGPEVVLVTLGEAGALGAWRAPGGRMSLRAGPPARHRTPFPTGCGDVFGAAFAFARIGGAAPDAALRFANGVAGTKAGLESVSALRSLRTAAHAALAELSG